MLLTKANVITVFVGSLKELGHVEYQRKSTDGEQKFDDSFPQSIDVISGIAVVDGVMNCHVPERIQSYECHIWFCGTFWLGLRPLTRSIKQTNKLSRHWKTGTVFENHRKKSHSTLRAKRATFTFWVDKKSFKCQKWSIFGESLKTLWPNSVTRQVNVKRTKVSIKMPKFKTSNETFRGIFKQCGSTKRTKYYLKSA